MVRFVLSVMGVPELHVGASADGPPLVMTRGSAALIALLAMQATGIAMTRERLADLIWPDTAPEQARSRLSSALWRLRRATASADLVEERSGRIGLTRSGILRVDFWELSQRVAALRGRAPGTWQPAEVAALESATQARRGVFLDTVEGDWVLAARQACAEAYEAGLECLLRFHRHRGQHDRAVAAARAIVRHDPYREDIHATLIELYAERGQHARAAEHFERCARTLRLELGIEPGGALRASLAGPQTAGIAPAGSRPAGATSAGSTYSGVTSSGVAPPDLAGLVADIDRSMVDLRHKIDSLKALLRASAPPAPPPPSARGANGPRAVPSGTAHKT